MPAVDCEIAKWALGFHFQQRPLYIPLFFCFPSKCSIASPPPPQINIILSKNLQNYSTHKWMLLESASVGLKPPALLWLLQWGEYLHLSPHSLFTDRCLVTAAITDGKRLCQDNLSWGAISFWSEICHKEGEKMKALVSTGTGAIYHLLLHVE